MMKQIGRSVRRVREEGGIRQKDLARRIGISQGALTNFELGRRNISLAWLVKIGKALDVPVASFLQSIDPSLDPETLNPKERRLVRAFRRMESDPTLQTQTLQLVERVSGHLERSKNNGSPGIELEGSPRRA